jgi:uncharacterized membrane protein YciS (DUF1049 family)
MLKTLLVIALVVAVLLGGLLALRSRRAGMPSEEVLKRAAKRASEQAAKDAEED